MVDILGGNKFINEIKMMTHDTSSSCELELPGEKLKASKMPGHWLLARLGKKVLRPGGLELTKRLLRALRLSERDDVVEFAPGLGVTARMSLQANPASYTAVERDAAAAHQVHRWLDQDAGSGKRQVITGMAQKTGLPGEHAHVVYGEAMLSMQAEPAKREIIQEAYRLLKPGGRYGIHELCLEPDALPAEEKEVICQEITQAIHHRALPLTGAEWEELLQSEGFEVEYRSTAPMALLEPGRLIKDEGLFGASRFLWRLFWDREARERVVAMRKTFRRHQKRMAAICLVAHKPGGKETGGEEATEQSISQSEKTSEPSGEKKRTCCEGRVFGDGIENGLPAVKTFVFPKQAVAGYSLMELLVVLGVGVILAGILFPVCRETLSGVDRSRCQHNLRQIVTALLNYTADHNHYLPVAAPHELGGAQGRVSEGDPWLPGRMFGGALPAEDRPLYAYVESEEVFHSPCDKGEPLWWFDTQKYQGEATCYELYGSSYFYASGYNNIGGVVAPMGIAKFVGTEFSYENFTSDPLPLGEALSMVAYPNASKKVIVGSIPIHRTMSGIVALSKRAQWYKQDTQHLWANAAFLDGHVEFVRVFPYDSEYASVGTIPDEKNPYY